MSRANWLVRAFPGRREEDSVYGFEASADEGEDV